MGLEGNFQSSALDYLNSLPGCVAENVSGNAHQSGRPDINGCFKGRMFKLELKTPDNKYQASKKQELNLRRWARSGCVVGVIYSMAMLKELFEKNEWFWRIRQVATESERREPNGCKSWYKIPRLED